MLAILRIEFLPYYQLSNYQLFLPNYQLQKQLFFLIRLQYCHKISSLQRNLSMDMHYSFQSLFNLY